jgi:hypothetical protein
MQYKKIFGQREWGSRFQTKSASILNLSLVVLIIGTVGTFLQVGGLNWDITMHLHRHPGSERLLVDAETFLSQSHTVLYTGVCLISVAAALGGILTWRLRTNRSTTFTIAFKLFIIGAVIQSISGPSDLWWHKTYGLDGLLSPPHIGLLSGMLINAFAATIGLSRIKPHILSKNTLIKSLMIISVASLWFSSTWFVYAFTLPVSKGQRTNNNLNPVLESLIAIITIPFIASLIFLSASKTIGTGFGAASTVAIVFIGINIFANIIPSKQLTQFLPWYCLFAYCQVIAADIIFNISEFKNRGNQKGSIEKNDPDGHAIEVHTRRTKNLIAGALLGSGFYILNFPMVALTFAVLFGFPLRSIILNEIYDFQSTLLLAIIITLIPGVIMGMLGTFIFMKRERIGPLSQPRQGKW